MRFTTALAVVTLVLGVAAEPILIDRQPTLVERDLPTITNVLAAVGSGLSTLDATVKAFTGDVSAIDRDSAALQDTINKGTSTVTGSDILTLNNAIVLAKPVQDMQGVGKALVLDLIAQKSAFEADGLCGDIYSQITGIQTASQGLIKAIVVLVPASAQGLAASLAAPFEAALKDGVAAFVSTNCTNAVISSSSSTASPSSTIVVSSTSSTDLSVSTTASSTTTTALSSSTTDLSSSIATSSSSIATGSSSVATGSSSIVTGSVTKTGPSATASGVVYITTTICSSTSPDTPKSTGAPNTESIVKTKPTTAAVVGSPTKTASSSLVLFTGAAGVNYATNSFGVLAIAAAAMLL